MLLSLLLASRQPLLRSSKAQSSWICLKTGRRYRKASSEGQSKAVTIGTATTLPQSANAPEPALSEVIRVSEEVVAPEAPRPDAAVGPADETQPEVGIVEASGATQPAAGDATGNHAAIIEDKIKAATLNKRRSQRNQRRIIAQARDLAE